MKRYFLLGILALTTLSMLATRPFRYVGKTKDGREVVFQKQGVCPSQMHVHTETSGLIHPLGYIPNTDEGLGVYGKSAQGSIPSVGELEIPVVMVAFADYDFQPTTTPELVDRIFNEEGYSDYDNTGLQAHGSVRDYFVQGSGNMFRPHFKVKGKVTLSGTRYDYGHNTSSKSGSDAGVSSKLYREALEAAVAQGIEFDDCKISKGKVPLVIFYHAGPGEHNSFEKGSSDYIWAHYMSYGITLNSGLGFQSYFIGSEFDYNYDADAFNTTGEYVPTTKNVGRIGVLIHELGHALGLNDYYVTSDHDATGTPDFWSVMDYGQYQENGMRPMPYSAYERNLLGWLDIPELPANGLQTLHPGEAYIVKNPDVPTQYYILETRGESNWYRSARFGEGMLLWKVNYVRNRWSSNTVNNTANNLGVQVIPADGVMQSHNTKKQWSDFRGDLYPGDSQDVASQTHNTIELYGQQLFRITHTGNGVVTFFTGTDGVENLLRPEQMQHQQVELNPWISIRNSKKYLRRN